MLVEDREDLLERGRLVGLFHRGEFAGEARGRRLEDLPLRIGLLGLVIGAEQVAGHLGDRHEVARVDLGLIFLGAARPHGPLDLGLALQGIERLAQGLVRGQLAHPDRLDLVHRHAKGHALLLEAEHVELQLHPGDFLLLQFDHPADTVLRVNDVVSNIEGVSLGRHVSSFRVQDRATRRSCGLTGECRSLRWSGPGPINRLLRSCLSRCVLPLGQRVPAGRPYIANLQQNFHPRGKTRKNPGVARLRGDFGVPPCNALLRTRSATNRGLGPPSRCVAVSPAMGVSRPRRARARRTSRTCPRRP